MSEKEKETIEGLPTCGGEAHVVPIRTVPISPETTLERAAGMFRAAGDVNRLRLLEYLMVGEQCVTEIAAALNANMSTVSQQLRLLKEENLVISRRSGKHIFYALADEHVRDILRSVLTHADHCLESVIAKGKKTMSECLQHPNHEHQHGPNCGHTVVQHDDHVDYLHDGHLHHPHGDHVDEHVIAVSETNPAECTPDHNCKAHEAGHVHGPGCGHEAVPHGDHVDYLVDGHLHHPHGDHCDDHGPLTVIK